MAKFKFDVFNAQEFNDELKRLNDYVATYKDKVQKSREAIAKRGIEIAKEEIRALTFPYDIPEDMASDYRSLLIAGLSYKIEGDDIVITDDSDQAMFIEFGTGIMGKTSPHASPVRGRYGNETKYVYDMNEHGYIGWSYHWGSKGEDGEYHTHGLPAGNYMYNTALRLTDEIEEIIKGVFERD